MVRIASSVLVLLALFVIRWAVSRSGRRALLMPLVRCGFACFCVAYLLSPFVMPDASVWGGQPDAGGGLRLASAFRCFCMAGHANRGCCVVCGRCCAGRCCCSPWASSPSPASSSVCTIRGLASSPWPGRRGGKPAGGFTDDDREFRDRRGWRTWPTWFAENCSAIAAGSWEGCVSCRRRHAVRPYARCFPLS